MNRENLSGQKTIDEAVCDGTIVDVSEIAKKAGIPFRTFMTPFMVHKYESEGSSGLFANLLFFADILSEFTGHDVYGPRNYGDHVCILEPHEKYGHIVLIVETGRLEDLDLMRTTSDIYEYSM